MTCENILKCISFNDKMASKPGTATLLKKCTVKVISKITDDILCTKNGRCGLSSDLFSNQTERVLHII